MFNPFVVIWYFSGTCRWGEGILPVQIDYINFTGGRGLTKQRILKQFLKSLLTFYRRNCSQTPRPSWKKVFRSNTPPPGPRGIRFVKSFCDALFGFAGVIWSSYCFPPCDFCCCNNSESFLQSPHNHHTLTRTDIAGRQFTWVTLQPAVVICSWCCKWTAVQPTQVISFSTAFTIIISESKGSAPPIKGCITRHNRLWSQSACRPTKIRCGMVQGWFTCGSPSFQFLITTIRTSKLAGLELSELYWYSTLLNSSAAGTLGFVN